jgi:hypothetical protein
MSHCALGLSSACGKVLSFNCPPKLSHSLQGNRLLSSGPICEARIPSERYRYVSHDSYRVTIKIRYSVLGIGIYRFDWKDHSSTRLRNLRRIHNRSDTFPRGRDPIVRLLSSVTTPCYCRCKYMLRPE